MLGRLSAATAALEATEIPNVPSDSDSESEHSSYTEKYTSLEFYVLVGSFYIRIIEGMLQTNVEARQST